MANRHAFLLPPSSFLFPPSSFLHPRATRYGIRNSVHALLGLLLGDDRGTIDDAKLGALTRMVHDPTLAAQVDQRVRGLCEQVRFGKHALETWIFNNSL